MVKNDKHRTRALIDGKRNEIEISEDLMQAITNFQDEVHHVAITYHQKLRDQSMTQSALDTIPGIGDKRKQELLTKFGSVQKIQEAEIDQLMKVKGITRKIAENIKEQLK